MKNTLLSILAGLLSFNSIVQAAETQPDEALIYELKNAMVKVSSSTKSGGHGWGTGVAITKDHILTNCHVLQDSDGISVSHWGVSYPPVGLQADWAHDLCILRFEWVGFKPVQLGDSENLQYEQPIISITMPGDSPAPYVSFNKIKALYPFDDEKVIRSSSAFAIGASGSPVFDYSGKLIATSTFKSPGQTAYYYNMPVAWVKKLMLEPEIKLRAPHGQPFWDAPEMQRPFFMRVVIPLQNAAWQDLQSVAKAWIAKEPANAEAYYYLALAEKGQGKIEAAEVLLAKTLSLNPQHADALLEQVKIATDTNSQADTENIHQRLISLSPDLEEAFQAALLGSQSATETKLQK